MLDKAVVVCKLCTKELANHQSYSSLKRNLSAKHVSANTDILNANVSIHNPYF